MRPGAYVLPLASSLGPLVLLHLLLVLLHLLRGLVVLASWMRARSISNHHRSVFTFFSCRKLDTSKFFE